MDFKVGNLIIKPLVAHLETMPYEVVGRLDTYCQVSHGGKTHRTRIANDMGKNPNWLDALEFPLKSKYFIVSVHEKDSDAEDYLIGSNRVQIENVMLAKVNYSNWFTLYKNEAEVGTILLQFEFYPEGEQGYGMQMELTSGLNSILSQSSISPQKSPTGERQSWNTSNLLTSLQISSVPNSNQMPANAQPQRPPQIQQSILQTSTNLPQNQQPLVYRSHYKSEVTQEYPTQQYAPRQYQPQQNPAQYQQNPVQYQQNPYQSQQYQYQPPVNKPQQILTSQRPVTGTSFSQFVSGMNISPTAGYQRIAAPIGPTIVTNTRSGYAPYRSLIG